jgi:hypothetical protein
MTKQHDLWNELGSLLSRSLATLEPDLDPRNHDLIADFIENREYEVAYRWITSLVQERHIQLSSIVAADIGRAAALMGISVDP